MQSKRRHPDTAQPVAAQSNRKTPPVDTAPVVLDLDTLKHVAGGSPKGTWTAPTVQSPKGTW